MTRRRSLDHLSVGLLGLVTISAYGSWYYAFGALLDPIRDDTGWSESSLAASFAAGTVLVGAGSVAGGRLLDRVGVRPVFLLAAFGGGAAFFVASAAQGVVVFAAASAAGMGLYGSLGFYHVTMTAVVRVNPLAPAPAIASLTLWGALASAIYLPLTAGLLGALDWRSTVRVLALLASAGFLLAALAVPDRPRGGSAAPDGEQRSPFGPGSARPPLREVLAAAVAPGGPRAFTLAVALAGIAISTVLVYQVPAMTAAGLPLGTAAAIAGIRGIGQLGGRLPLAPLVRRLGTVGAFRLAFVSLGVGGALLAVAGTVPVALAFAATAGFGIGAYSPLQGIGADELFDRRTLGVTMGFHGSVLMLAGALGPAVAGVLAESTGDRRWASVVIVGASLGAMVSVSRVRGTAGPAPRPSTVGGGSGRGARR